jgi:transcriptional regulator with GAF, ATPase, and Fis domain
MWLWTWDASSTATIGITAGMQSCNIEVRAWCGRSESTSGVVVFSEVTPNVCDLIHVASDSGDTFVLAIAEKPLDAAYPSYCRLLAAGASDVITWMPGDSSLVWGVVARLNRQAEIEQLLASTSVRNSFSGNSSGIRQMLRQTVECAVFSQASILLSGESGTGKEVMARLIHELDRRSQKGRFVVVDCTTISPHLAGSELFGHAKGAFTSAHTDREGAFSLADGGTLFLDEVGELPIVLQAELLRVLQEKSFKPIGGNSWRETDFRLIAATNRELADDVRKGLFRHDLYFRLTAGFEITLPPLRSRRDDIPILSKHFVRQFFGASEPPELAPELLDFLLRGDYPGNVRQLKGLVERMAMRYCGHGPLTLGTIPPDDRLVRDDNAELCDQRALSEYVRNAVQTGCSLKEIGKRAQDRAIQIAIALDSGNLHRAAQRLHVSDRALQLRVAASRQGARELAVQEECCSPEAV